MFWIPVLYSCYFNTNLCQGYDKSVCHCIFLLSASCSAGVASSFYWHRARIFSALWWGSWGCLRRGHSLDEWPWGANGIFQSMAACSVYKVKRRRRKERTFRLMVFPTLVTVTCDGALCPGDGWTPSGHGEQGINSLFCFALLVCVAFAFPDKFSLSQPTSSFPFTLPVTSPKSECPMFLAFHKNISILSCSFLPWRVQKTER